MHLGLASQPGHALAESPAIGPYGMPQGVVGVENRAKAERQHRSTAETYTYDAGMLQYVFLPKLDVVALVLADDYVEFSAGIGQHGCSVDALDAFQQGRTARTNSI